MTNRLLPETQRVSRNEQCPAYLHHVSFDEPGATREYDPRHLLGDGEGFDGHYMPDEITRTHSQHMHYAAHRIRTARRRADSERWFETYLALRDRIVLGNRKLVYKAVRRRMAQSNHSDDLIGDCQIVLIHVVAAFNPWLAIRFSTYAYTCLLRALGRLSQRHSADWLARALPFDSLPDGEPQMKFVVEPRSTGSLRLEDYLREDHPLLTDREKAILVRRFLPRNETAPQTLETVGRSLGLSKERVRQVQAAALNKLRVALSPESLG